MKGIWTCIKYKNEVVNPDLPLSDPTGVRPTIYLWIRDTEGKRHRLKITGFRPYFYVSREVKSKATSLLDALEIEEIEDYVAEFGGQKWPLIKIYTYNPSHVRKLRKQFSELYGQGVVKEGDVLFELRYLIDKGIRGAVKWTSPEDIRPIKENLQIPLRRIYLDIEIYARRIIRQGMMSKKEYIQCISAYDNYEKVYFTWYYNLKDLGVKGDKNWKVIYCKSVQEMLIKFFEYVKERDPDVITGYNVDFDLLVLRTEALRRNLGKYLDYLSALSDLGYSVGRPVTKKKRIRGVNYTRKGLVLDGREVVDLLDLVRMISRTQLPEYSLDYVAKKFLGEKEGKLKLGEKSIASNLVKAWEENPELVLKYNKHDVELCVKLDEKNNLIDFLDELRKTVGVRLNDALSQQRMIDTEMLRRTKAPLPSKFTRKKDEKESYKGAIVVEPKLGLHKWVACLDWKSLYPSIIRTFNIDIETYVRDIRKANLKNCYILTNEDRSKKWIFRKEPRGLVPQMLDDFVEWRDKYKQMMKKEKDPEKKRILNIKQEVYKVLANAVYGSFGYRSRIHSLEVAEAVTSMGRLLILFAKNVAETLGFRVIYGDTDSVMITSNAKSFGEAYNNGVLLQDEILKRLPKYLRQFGWKGRNSYFYIKLEKIYDRFFMAKKKRYCGRIVTLSGEKKIDVKGLDVKRSDTSNFSRKLQEELIKTILEGRTSIDIAKRIAEKINKYDLLPLEEIGVPSAISKPFNEYKANSIQKRAALNSNEYLGTKFDYGDKPKRVYIIPPQEYEVDKNIPKFESKVKKDLNVIAFDENTKFPEWVKVDYPKMIQKTVKPKIEKFLEALNLSWEEIEVLLREELRSKKRVKKRKKKVSEITLDRFLGERKDVDKISSNSAKRE